MDNRFWLVQRGSFNSLDTATKFLGGSEQHLIDPEYMGAAEFEWGAIPKAYRRILGQFDKYKLHVTDLVTIGGVPFCLYCQSDCYDLILSAIKSYLNGDFHTKEWTNIKGHFTPINPDDSDWEKDQRKHEFKTNFWWCIDNTQSGDWIAFTGAADRQTAFLRILKNDHDSWWMKKTDEEREREYLNALQTF